MVLIRKGPSGPLINVGGGGGAQTWADTLALGDTTDGVSPIITFGDVLAVERVDMGGSSLHEALEVDAAGNVTLKGAYRLGEQEVSISYGATRLTGAQAGFLFGVTGMGFHELGYGSWTNVLQMGGTFTLSARNFDSHSQANVLIKGSDVSGSGNYARLYLLGETDPAGGGADAHLDAGDAPNVGASAAGDLYASAGDSPSPTSQVGGIGDLRAGDCFGAAGTGGSFTIRGGDATNPVGTRNGGAATLLGGAAWGTGAGGIAEIRGGSSVGGAGADAIVGAGDGVTRGFVRLQIGANDRFVVGDDLATLTVGGLDTVFGPGYLKLAPISGAGVPIAPGTIFYDNQNDCYTAYYRSSGASIQLGREFWVGGVNKSGILIENGSVCYIAGGLGNKAKVAKASAALWHSQPSIGIATEDIATDDYGEVTTKGLVRNLNTLAWPEGTTLYLGAVAGTLSSVPPVGVTAVTKVATVLYSHGSNGIIYVDVRVMPATLADNGTLLLEPAGFPASEKAKCVITADGALREMRITASADLVYYAAGKRYTMAAGSFLNVTWPDLDGIHYFYIDQAGVLQTTQDGPTWIAQIDGDGATVAAVTWDANANDIVGFWEERHGLMPGAVHVAWHTAIHALWVSGGGLTVPSGSGAANADAQVTVATGTFIDEDLRHTVADFLAGATTNVVYRYGATGVWKAKRTSAFPFVESGSAGYIGANGRIAYNQWTGATWQLTEIGQANYICVHAVFVPEAYIAGRPAVMFVLGQAEYTTIAAARLGAQSEVFSLQGVQELFSTEAAWLGTFLVQSSTAYGNSPKARTVWLSATEAYVDWRHTGGGVSAGGAAVALATTTTPGIVQLAGDLAGTGLAPLVAKVTSASEVNLANAAPLRQYTNHHTGAAVAVAGTGDIRYGFGIDAYIRNYENNADVELWRVSTGTGEAFFGPSAVLRAGGGGYATLRAPTEARVSAGGNYILEGTATDTYVSGGGTRQIHTDSTGGDLLNDWETLDPDGVLLPGFNNRRGYRFWDEFFGIPSVNTSSPLYTIYSGTGAGAASIGVAASGEQGVIRLNTGTGTTGTSNVTTYPAGTIFGEGYVYASTKAKLSNLADVTDDFVCYLGLHDSPSADATNGVYFRYNYNVNGGRWQAVTRNGGVETAADTGVAGDTSWHLFEVFVNDPGTSATFKIDGTLVATIATNIPTGYTAPSGWAVRIRKTAGTNARYLYVDWLGGAVKPTTAR